MSARYRKFFKKFFSIFFYSELYVVAVNFCVRQGRVSESKEGSFFHHIYKCYVVEGNPELKTFLGCNYQVAI